MTARRRARTARRNLPASNARRPAAIVRHLHSGLAPWRCGRERNSPCSADRPAPPATRLAKWSLAPAPPPGTAALAGRSSPPIGAGRSVPPYPPSWSAGMDSQAAGAERACPTRGRRWRHPASPRCGPPVHKPPGAAPNAGSVPRTPPPVAWPAADLPSPRTL